MNMVTLPLI